jgi:hypothetical protein
MHHVFPTFAEGVKAAAEQASAPIEAWSRSVMG